MHILALIAGITVILMIIGGFFYATAWAAGWRFAIALWSFSVTVTAAALFGAFLIGYGATQ